MSNKSIGTAFERELAQILSIHGFWAHCLKDNQNGQPFDVIAARNGISYVFDCKDCQGKTFQLKRIEENQHNAMALWAATGNRSGLFAIRFKDHIYLVPHKMLQILQENGTAGITEADAYRYGRSIDRWLSHQDELDKRVMQCR